MNERQRADQLARAIDELINGTPRPGPASFDDQELQSLLHVAQARLAASKNAAKASADYEAAVWQQLIARLEGRPQPAQTKPDTIATDPDIQQTVAARREMSAAILAGGAAQGRGLARVQERLKGRPASPRTPQSPSRVTRGGPGEMPRARTRFFPTGDADIDSLLAAALNRPTLRAASTRAAEPFQRRLHDRQTR
jgi:hypothetical protein